MHIVVFNFHIGLDYAHEGNTVVKLMKATKADDAGVDLDVQKRRVKEGCVGSLRDNRDLNMKFQVIRERFILRWCRSFVTRIFARYLRGVYGGD